MKLYQLKVRLNREFTTYLRARDPDDLARKIEDMPVAELARLIFVRGTERFTYDYDWVEEPSEEAADEAV